jgi:hypothetical protein
MHRSGLVCLILLSALVVSLSAEAAAPTVSATAPRWKKTHIDKTFRSEGVAVADVNKDGKLDILVGDVWYEAPEWKVHPIRKVGNYGDGSRGYSQCFACWAEDINGDSYPDLIVVGFPGAPCHWYENPKGSTTELWKAHQIWHSACNETPQYVDLFGTGKRVLLMGWQPKGKENEGQMAWFTPGKDPTQTWEMHPVSTPSAPGKPTPGTHRFAHGLGIGDLNGDGRRDVLCTGGWWEQPAKDEGKPWTFHPAKLGDACADMYAFDLDHDGKADVLSSSAHNYGVWWHKQRPGKDGNPSFERKDILKGLVSQTHAMHFVDINGDGLADLVTGKRWWAHGPHGDADPNVPADLYWLEARQAKDGVTSFTVHRIDNDSGIGTQFFVGDVNGDKLPDIAISNKKGVYLIEQVRSAAK